MLQLDIESMRTLLAVLDYGGMTRAAERLNMGQSAVSRKIQRLEERVGRPLLIRDGHAVRPTREGRLLLSDARAMVELHDRAVARLASSEVTGTVKLGCNGEINSSRIASLLRTFKYRHPGATVEFTLDHTGALVDRVDDGSLDIGIIQVTDERARPTDIELWWDRWPEANVGVVTGWASALVVVDVDPRNGGDATLAALEASDGALPATVTCLTGGGGRHLYFAHPTNLVPSRPLGAGLDLKAEGGVVVAPPSQHACGARYRWQPGHGPGEHELAALPDWLERLSVSLIESRAAGPPVPVARTAQEQATFAEFWSSLGVEVGVEAGEFMVRCPLHDDHHPSLHIDPDGCRWFCFGCRRGGGIQALRRIVHPDDGPPPGRGAVVGGEPETPTLAPDRSVDVVGESAHQDELLALTGGRRTRSGAHRRVVARLEPVDDNPFDDQAVAVTIEDHLVGFLPLPAAALYRPLVEEAIGRSGAAACLAEIRGGWERSPSDVGRFGVVVLLPDAGRDR